MAALSPGLRSALQRGLREVRERHEAWRGALASFGPSLTSLANLAEQARALEAKADSLGQGPLGAFPELPQRLRAKHRGAAEALLTGLQQEKLLELQKVRDAVGSHVARIFLLYEGWMNETGQESSFQRSSLCPSLADMLEWLLDIEGFYHRIYLEAKLLLLQIRYENLVEMQALPKAWEQVIQHSLQSTVEDALLKVSFFLEEAV